MKQQTATDELLTMPDEDREYALGLALASLDPSLPFDIRVDAGLTLLAFLEDDPGAVRRVVQRARAINEGHE